MSVAGDPFPLGPLLYLYVGCADTTKELAFYNEALGADLVWRFQAFGADVAAVRIGGEESTGPLVLLADHRPVPSVLPIYGVRSVPTIAQWLVATGWAERTARVEVPDGPCLVVADQSGNEIGLLQQDRPDAMPGAYRDATNARAVR
jgi:catechol 2,3-dioxygenase-like lactoylglutathione lyase family enzyme